MNKNILAIGITILFLITTVTPITLGYDVESRVKSTYDGDRLEDYYDVYSLEEIPKSIRPVIIDDSENIITPVEINVSASKELMNPIQCPPMDSPWPMYCHDVRHTGQSLYGTDGDYFQEKWKFWMEDVLKSSPAIDKNGTLYVGDFNYFLNAIYPNGTLKWKFKTEDWGGSAPTIGDDGTIYFGACDQYLYALYPNGTLKWRFSVGWDALTSSPALGEDGNIYFGCHAGYI